MSLVGSVNISDVLVVFGVKCQCTMDTDSAEVKRLKNWIIIWFLARHQLESLVDLTPLFRG